MCHFTITVNAFFARRSLNKRILERLCTYLWVRMLHIQNHSFDEILCPVSVLRYILKIGKWE